MSKLPGKCLVDTNVPVTAILSARSDPCSDEPDFCILESIRQIENITGKGACLVVDHAGEIFKEYKNNLSLGGQQRLRAGCRLQARRLPGNAGSSWHYLSASNNRSLISG